MILVAKLFFRLKCSLGVFVIIMLLNAGAESFHSKMDTSIS